MDLRSCRLWIKVLSQSSRAELPTIWLLLLCPVNVQRTESTEPFTPPCSGVKKAGLQVKQQDQSYGAGKWHSHSSNLGPSHFEAHARNKHQAILPPFRCRNERLR